MQSSRSFSIIAAVLCLSGCQQHLAGQILDFQMRQELSDPWEGTAYPADQFIQVTAPSGWKASLTGELLSACRGGPCFTVAPRPDATQGNAAVSYIGFGAALPVGLHTSTIDIGARHWTIRLNVVRRLPYLPFYYRPGYPQGCHNSDKHMPQEDTCVISGEQPAQSMGALTRQGDSFLDPQFGSPVHRLTNDGLVLAYSSVRMFSANNRFVLLGDLDGFLYVWERATNRQWGERFGGVSLGQVVWDPKIEERLWIITGGKVSTRNVLTGKVTVTADYTESYRDRPGLTAMSTGGTADNTDDNWWAFTDDKEKLVCALDLNGLTLASQEQHVYCANYGELDVQNVDFPQITQVDQESHQRYVLLLSAPRAHVFTVNMAALKLDHDYQMPPEITTPHSDVGQDSHGRQVLFWSWYTAWGDKSFAATSQLNKREKLTVPVEAGGGLSILFPLYAGAIRTDMHFGCNWSSVCVISTYSEPISGGIPNWAIKSVTSGTPCVVQVASNYPFKDGSQVAIGGVGEMAGVNGVSKITVIDPRNFALTDKTCSGQYTRQLGHVAEAKQWTPTSPNREEITVVRLDGEVRRVAIHRSKLWAEHGRLSLYWAAPQAGLSRDGRYVGFTSNLGLPELDSVFWTEVDRPDEIRNPQVLSAEKSATIHWEGPEAALIKVSVNADMEGPLLSRQHPAGDGREQIVEGLGPNTLYYYQILGTGSAARGTFTTMARGGPAPK